MACIVTTVLIVVMAAAPAILATDYTVGDSSGWSTGVDFGTWASDKTFKTGDTLLFQYGMLHSVNEVSKADYDACSTSNSIQSYNDQNTKITFDQAGITRYFICGTPGHCSGGMKLAVPVATSGGGGGGGSSPSMPTTPSNPGSPSPPSGSGSKNTPLTTSGASVGGNGLIVVGVSLFGIVLALLG